MFIFRVIGISVAGLCGVVFCVGQTISIAITTPDQRDVTVEAGNLILSDREKPIPSDIGAPDPFIGVVEEVVEDSPVIITPIVKVVNQGELLQRLANSIQARGTAILGEDRFLLLSQKRLKVGESIVINLDGRDYELWLSSLTSTTFTVRLNDLSYTRAVLLSR